jgi:hypothetical protein
MNSVRSVAVPNQVQLHTYILLAFCIACVVIYFALINTNIHLCERYIHAMMYILTRLFIYFCIIIVSTIIHYVPIYYVVYIFIFLLSIVVAVYCMF